MDDTRLFDKKIILLSLALGIWGFGCAAVSVPSIGQEGYVPAEDERRMHKRAQEMCVILDESGYIYPDQELENYLTDVLKRILRSSGHQDGLAVEVKVLSDPSLNAFTFPNGRIYIHTGMLAAMDNEAQLAALLSHEVIHALNRHALKQFRSLTNKSAFFAAMQVPVAFMGGNLGALVAQMSMVSSVSGYSQHHEFEADREGFVLMRQDGYDPREAPKLFEHVRDFIKEEDLHQPFFFSTHPNVVARIDNFNDFIAQEKPAAEEKMRIEEAGYKRHVRRLILDNISFCLQEGMFKTAQRLVDQYIGGYKDDAVGYFYRGELYRQRQDRGRKEKVRPKAQDYPEALKSYEQAIACDPNFSAAYREKAKVLQKLGRMEESREALRKYLDLNPQAEDKEYVEQLLSSP